MPVACFVNYVDYFIDILRSMIITKASISLIEYFLAFSASSREGNYFFSFTYSFIVLMFFKIFFFAYLSKFCQSYVEKVHSLVDVSIRRCIHSYFRDLLYWNIHHKKWRKIDRLNSWRGTFKHRLQFISVE